MILEDKKEFFRLHAGLRLHLSHFHDNVSAVHNFHSCHPVNRLLYIREYAGNSAYIYDYRADRKFLMREHRLYFYPCFREIDIFQALPAEPWSIRDCCRFNAVVNELIAALLEGDEEAGLNPMLRNPRYRELLDYVNENLSAELTVEELASFMKMGREIFSRKFRADFGLAPKEFLTRMLLRRASDLLLAPNIRVKEVAARLKFRNEFYFSRFFRKHTNIPPGEYRRFYRE